MNTSMPLVLYKVLRKILRWRINRYEELLLNTKSMNNQHMLVTETKLMQFILGDEAMTGSGTIAGIPQSTQPVIFEINK